MSVGDVKDFVELYEIVKDTPFAIVIPIILIVAVGSVVYKWIVTPLWKNIVVLFTYIQKKRFAKKQFHENLSFMNSDDVYHSISHFVPTRYTSKDPANNDEPIPEYLGEDAKRKPLLINHFLKYEFDQKYGRKYYLCLGDCGIGKTTFLINLYYETLRQQKKRNCAFISLQDSGCIAAIEKISNQEKTILLLDALDENENAVTNFDKFMTDLENATKKFYRVIVTSRTNFFVTEEKERLSNKKSSISTSSKFLDARKYYIAPFTDEDIQRYLKHRYHAKKYRQAWELMEANKNLSVRPMLLRYMDDLLAENKNFKYDFQLYEYLFVRWIERERGALSEELGKGLYNECILLAKAIYYQWRKTGRAGLFTDEVDENNVIPGLSQIKFRGHALLNRTSEGMYKFAHKSFWEYLLAKIAMQDISFADDLLIRNFDQAEAFFEEMISSGEFQSTESLLGIACYYIKYKKPEEAEKILLEVLERTISEDITVFAQVLLIKSYQRQMKEASAEIYILRLYNHLRSIDITANYVPLLTKFGVVLAEYSRKRKLRMGQEFFGRIIEFCRDNDITGYDLLICYERYCFCALNYCLKEDAMVKMERAMLLQEKDQFAEYLYIKASNWGKRFDDAEALTFDNRLVTKYGKLQDSYELIVGYCYLACSMMAVYHETREGSFENTQDAAVEYIVKAFDICSEIYDDEFETIHNPYMALLSLSLIRYFGYHDNSSDFRARKLEEETRRVLQYCQDHHLEAEMQTVYCQILYYASKYLVKDYQLKEHFQVQRLDSARLIKCPYEEISSLWDLFVLCDNHDHAQEGQVYLKQAYEIAKTNADFMETPQYCLLLQVVLDYGEGIDKTEVYQKLYQTAPRVYGKDKRKERVYRSLRRFASQQNDGKAVEFAREVLLCDFSYTELEKCYEAYRKFSNDACFVDDLEAVLRELPEITPAYEKSIERFLESTFEDAEEQSIIEGHPISELSEKVNASVKRIKQEKEQEQFSKRFNTTLSDTNPPILA